MKEILTFALFTFLFGSLYAQEKTRIDSLSTTNYIEFAPTISADGRTLIFETDRGNGWELFESKKNDVGIWSTPLPLTAINEKCDFIAGPNLSYDGNLLYYTAFIEGVTESEDIFYSKRLEGDTWSEPIRVAAPINTPDYEGFPSVTADGNTMYFIRVNYKNQIDKTAKENCFTIYVSHKINDTEWGTPTPLPIPINLKCERDPKIMADNRTLIFSSIRPGGQGKFDMYQTQLQDDGSWSDPFALDYINSPENDQSPCIPASGDIMYYVSNDDIWSVTIPQEYRQLINVNLSGLVVDNTSRQPLKAQITLAMFGLDEAPSHLENNSEDGSFSVVMRAGERYSLTVSSDRHLQSNLELDYTKVEYYREIKQNFELESNYVALLDAKDLEVKKDISSFVLVKNSQGQILFSDSVGMGKIASLELSSIENYTLEAMTIGYEPRDSSLVFNPAIFRKSTPIILSLIKEKVFVSISVSDLSSNKKLKMKVYYQNQDEDETIIGESGQEVRLRRGDRYEVFTSSDKGYVFASASLIAGEGFIGPDGKLVKEMDLKVARIEEGGLLTLNQITFATNSADLNESSFFELDRVVELLKNNKKIVVEVAAHTDDIGDDNYNLKLSERRALSAMDYLLKKGIPNKQIVAKGYGETVPLKPNDSDENRAFNRRVELRIISTK